MSKFAVSVGSGVGKYGTKAVLGLGYMALRGAYALGEAGEAAIASGTVEAERLAVHHEALLVKQRAEAAVRRTEIAARMLALKNEKAAALAIEATTAAVMAPVEAPVAAKVSGRKTAAA